MAAKKKTTTNNGAITRRENHSVSTTSKEAEMESTPRAQKWPAAHATPMATTPKTAKQGEGAEIKHIEKKDVAAIKQVADTTWYEELHKQRVPYPSMDNQGVAQQLRRWSQEAHRASVAASKAAQVARQEEQRLTSRGRRGARPPEEMHAAQAGAPPRTKDEDPIRMKANKV